MTKIPVSLRNEYLLLSLEDIQFIKSDGSYSIIHTSENKYTTSKNLKHYESLLENLGFLRVSNSHVISIDKVVKYLREDGGMIELLNKVKIPISRNKRESVKRLLGI